MKGYSAREVFTPRELELHARATRLVAGLSDPVNVNDVRCHELARAVGLILDLPVVDGRYKAVEHSWLQTPDRIHGVHNILDVYAVGIFPMVHLVYASWVLHRTDPYVTKPIADLVVDDAKVEALKTTMLENELGEGDAAQATLVTRWRKKTVALQAMRTRWGLELERNQETILEAVSIRASGSSECELCGLAYHDHPHHPGAEWLTILCNGTLVKL